jgi:crotonobetaine/carnitine-CoA ligase
MDASTTLHDLLRQRASERPDVAYVVAEGSSWTYAEADTLADRAAAALDRLGVGVGDRVGVLSGNNPLLVPLAFGTNRLGAAWVPTNTDYKGSWLRQTLDDSAAKVLVVDPTFVSRVEQVRDRSSSEHLVVGLEPLFGDDLSHPEPEVHPGTTAAVLWTSGTTGRSKGVMQSHAAWLRAARSGAASAGTRDGDVLYCCLPLYNSASWVSCIYRALVAGVTVAIDGRFSVGEFWDRTRRFGATQAFTLGSMHMFLWQQPERSDDGDNPVRTMGAVPMPDALLDPFKRRFGIERIQQGYGQSEVMGLISRVDDGSITWNDGSVGVPLPGIEVRLLDDDDREVLSGEVGEFCVRPLEPHTIFNGYLGNPEATLAAFRNLWYHTGDLGRRDADGQFHFVDRKADLIRHKGRSVASAAVEAAVRAHPAVADVAAFGVATAELVSEAEIMVAVVLTEGSATTADDLARFVNETAPYFFVPRFIDIVDDLPRTPTGKVQKFDLRGKGITSTTWDREAVGFEVRR